MTKVKVYNQSGTESGTVELAPSIFGMEKPRTALVQAVAVSLLAGKRNTVAATKTRGMVRGGGKKPWQQKGTGRARAGSIRSPLWRGGGIIFGPQPNRNYEKKVSKKEKRLGLFSVLSERARGGRVLVVDNLDIAGGKTKAASETLKTLRGKFAADGKNILVIVPPKRPELIRAMRNLPAVQVALADSINLLELLWANNIIILKDSLVFIEKTYGTAR